MSANAGRAAASLFTAGGVGALLHSWYGNEAPANLPSHPHHHHYSAVATPASLTVADLAHEAPVTADNSRLGLVETWVGPSAPANTTHSFALKTKKNPLEIGVETTASNSVFGLLHNWFGSPDSAPAKQ